MNDSKTPPVLNSETNPSTHPCKILPSSHVLTIYGYTLSYLVHSDSKISVFLLLRKRLGSSVCSRGWGRNFLLLLINIYDYCKLSFLAILLNQPEHPPSLCHGTAYL